jgi:hypothetical protein
MLFAPLQAGAEEALRLPDARVADERIEVAQAREPRNIFELIFGVPDEPTPQQPQQPTRRTTDSTPAAPAAPAPPPAVDKNEGATRMAVIGDSMAVDLANALERFYAEDPNIIIDGMGVGSSGFVRDDFFDWNATIRDAVVQDRFDIAVVIIGVNDRQALRVNGQNANSLTEEWISAYSARLSDALNTMRAAGIPVIWVGMPPMQQPSYSAAISQISGVQRLAAFSGGAEFVDIFERYADEAGNYTSSGPDLNGNIVTMRKSDGIHLSSAGADKLAFYVNQAVRLYYRGGSVSIEIADPLAGTDAQDMIRLPYQGLGQIRLLEVAGAVLPLDGRSARASDLLTAETVDSQAAFELEVLMQAPVGRVDAFGVGYDPAEEDGEETPGER